MKKAGIILAAVMALAISGCNEVPEDVRSRTEAKNQAISEAEKHLEERTGEIRYISPDELDDDIKAALGQSYANFSIDPSVKVSVPKEIVKCDFKQTGLIQMRISCVKESSVRDQYQISKSQLTDPGITNLIAAGSETTRRESIYLYGTMDFYAL